VLFLFYFTSFRLNEERFFLFLLAPNYKGNHRNPSPPKSPSPDPNTEGGDCGGFELNEAALNAESFIQVRKEVLKN
jgi:hypothetical protein